MNNYWFTADLHLGHANVIKYCERPWAHVDDMDEALIRNWNNAVLPQDVVVCCGDFCLVNKRIAKQYLDMLNGNIIMLKGNHDHWMNEKRYEYHKNLEVAHLYCTHYPLRTWPRSFKSGLNIHGHCHGNLQPLFYNQLDVGVDNVFKLIGEYRPIDFGEVCRLIDEQNKIWVKENKEEV